MNRERLEEEMMMHVALGHTALLAHFPHHSFYSHCCALRSALALTKAFDRGGAHQARRLLEHIPVCTSTLSSYPHDIRVLQARKEAMRLQSWVTLILGDRLCFASSFAICAGLRRLGYSCFVEIGYEYIHQYTETPLHAYVVYEEEIVNDTPDIRYSFVPLLAYGKEGTTQA